MGIVLYRKEEGMEANRSGKGKRGKKGKPDSHKENHRTPSARELLLPKKHPVRHSNLPIPEPRMIKEPLPVCPLCGKQVENIAEAITAPDGSYCHFDCVITQLTEQEKPKENQMISYVGSGNFAVVEKGTDGKFTIVKKFEYEKREAFDAMKKYVEASKIG
jgi:hypothetical protein